MTTTPHPLPLAGRHAVVTGGTDGIGRATVRLLAAQGADVVAIGRSPDKARALEAEVAAAGSAGRVRVLTRDLSLMRTVATTVEELADTGAGVDLLVHAVGVLLTRPAWTTEGVELDLAVSYLSRFAFLEDAHRLGLVGPRTRMVNIAASAPEVPRAARVSLETVEEVRSRTGMRSHGQAQLANDLLTAHAPTRYGVTAVGYGPGAVDTSIRREVPRLLRLAMAPFYASRTRSPGDAAADVVAALTDPSVAPGSATFRSRDGAFPTTAYVADARRQERLVAVSEELLSQARAA